MYQYRVTKYNPARRDPTGAYPVDEWTSVSDIGRSFGGTILTKPEYDRMERAYIVSAVAFLQEARLHSLRVEGLENYQDLTLPFADGDVLTLEQVPGIIGQILREEFWCRLEGEGGYLHFGYDYYMYVGVVHACPVAKERAAELGLYVEEIGSPSTQSN
jgi:hypothetical protein